MHQNTVPIVPRTLAAMGIFSPAMMMIVIRRQEKSLDRAFKEMTIQDSPAIIVEKDISTSESLRNVTGTWKKAREKETDPVTWVYQIIDN